MSYLEAEKASSGLIQLKAIHVAEEKDVLIEVAVVPLGSAEATTIAHVPGGEILARIALKKGLRQSALLGCGSVGAGVLEASPGPTGLVRSRTRAGPPSRSPPGASCCSRPIRNWRLPAIQTSSSN